MSDTYGEISVKLAQVILPMIVVVGVTGNSLNLVILTRANLRNHACSRYFLALASNNLIYSVFVIQYLLANGYQIDVQTMSNASCKIIQYIASAGPFLSPYFIILASLDRFCASSSNARLRAFSSVKVAQRLILVIVTLVLLFFINTLVLNEYRDDDYYGCALRPETTYHQLYFFVQILLFAAVPPILMILFGLLTIYNTTRLRVAPQATMRYRRTEGQLARMLFLQVLTYILLNMPLCIMYLMLINPSDLTQTAEFYFALSITQILFHFSFATTFFLYILSARVYREELLRLIGKIYHLEARTQVQPMSTTHAVDTTRLQKRPTLPN